MVKFRDKDASSENKSEATSRRHAKKDINVVKKDLFINLNSKIKGKSSGFFIK